MSQPFRRASGGLVDRARTLRFSFNGRELTGLAGDTLASALLANGIHLVARSFKFHRPRGFVAAGAEEPNAIVQLGSGAWSEPNLKATQIELADAMTARSVNCRPSPRFDIGAINGLFGRFLPTGFYYKTFKWPNWGAFEPAIRNAAGLGRAPDAVDPDLYVHGQAECDVLVVGAGSSGIRSALASAQCGKRVILAEEDWELGGASIRVANALDPRLAELRAHNLVTVLTRTCVLGYYDHNHLVALERTPGPGARERLWKVRASEVVLATGAIERPMVFPGNDRPGIMLASAVRTYLERYAVLCGRDAIVFTNNDSAYDTAFALMAAGARVRIVDVRCSLDDRLSSRAAAAGIALHQGQIVAGTSGRLKVNGARLMHLDGRPAGKVACDLIAISSGWSPAVHLYSQSGGSLRFDEDKAMFVPHRASQKVNVVGRAAGEIPDMNICPIWSVRAGPNAFVDFANDVSASDVQLAARENYRSVEHLKRYTTLGMGVDQGKISNVNGLAIMGEAIGRTPAQVGTTKFRPPYNPVSLGSIAGPHVGTLYQPFRYLPAHEWHCAAQAAFEEYSGWLRPTAYPTGSESWEQAASREAHAVRTGVGLFDASPLGKIEVLGPDAGRFLDHIYVGNASNLAVGRARYGIMLSEQGVVGDDGVFVRIAADHFLLHTTSGGAARVARSLEEWLQCEWPDLDVVVVPATTAWATFTISGPLARSVLVAAGTDTDLDPTGFAHMRFRQASVAGIPARILRASFTGEVSFEVSVAVDRACLLAEALWESGRGFGITRYGIEALMVLRTEKGYLHIGADTDGTTLPDDVGMAGGVGRKEANFVGRRSLQLPDAIRPDRRQLVGLLSSDGRRLPVGAQILDGPMLPCVSAGHVTSSVDSPTLGRPIALAMIAAGRSRAGESVKLYDMGEYYSARIVDPVFVDPEGARLRG